MIYQTPISQYNMQNVQQLGQIMDEQESYTPSINPFNTVMSVPPGYSMYQWQQELSLARNQYLVRPLMATGNLVGSSAAYAFAYSPLFSQMLPERYGAELREINGVTKWAGGTSKWATRIGNAALNIEKASSAFASGIGTAGGKAVGWGAGQLGRGLIRTGEATANYLSGGFFTSANQWLGAQFGTKSGVVFNQNLSGYIDTAAAYANRSIDYVGELLENSSNIKKAEAYLEDLRKSGTATAEAIKDAEQALKYAKIKRTGFRSVDFRKAFKEGKLGLQTLTGRIGGGIGNLIGAFFSPTVLLKQAVIDRLIDFGTESYEAYNTTMDLNREILAKGGRILRFGDASSITGVDGGLTEAQRNRLVSHIDRLASEDYTVRRNDMLGMGSWSILGGHKKYVENLKELKALLSVSTDMGMLDMSRSLDEVEKRFDTIVKAVKKMSRITGKSKGELAMALASTQQSEARFDIGDAVSSLQRKIYAATLSGASLQTVLQEAALGSQMGVQAGLGKAAGADFMVQSRNIYQRMYRRRMLDRGDIDMMGGEQGVVSGIAAGMMSVANNDVFKSQLAMFFDTKTGRMDRSRLESYINGEDVMGHAIERNLAMSRMSINPFTGVNEAGGKLRGRMMFVDRALQHGDISMNQIVGVARQLMKENRIKYGEAQAEYMMMGYFANTMGIDKAHLIMRALKDDSLMRPDIKEMMAVSRKQTEDRYAAEYQRAAESTSFWMPVLGGLGAGAALFKGATVGSAGGLVGAAFGAAVGLGVHYALKNNNTWLGFGYNRISPEMLRIRRMGSDYKDFWNNESGIDRYKRLSNYAELTADVNIPSKDVSTSNSRFYKYKSSLDNLDIKAIKEKDITSYYEDYTQKSFWQRDLIDNNIGYAQTLINRAGNAIENAPWYTYLSIPTLVGFGNYYAIKWASEKAGFNPEYKKAQKMMKNDIYKFMSGTLEDGKEVLSRYMDQNPEIFKNVLKDKEGLEEIIGKAKRNIKINNLGISDDEVNIKLQERLNVLKTIEESNVERKDLENLDLYKMAEDFGVTIGVIQKTFEGSTKSTQAENMDSFYRYILELKQKKEDNDPVYLALKYSANKRRLQKFLTSKENKTTYKNAGDLLEYVERKLTTRPGVNQNRITSYGVNNMTDIALAMFNDTEKVHAVVNTLSDDLAFWAYTNKPVIEGLDYTKYQSIPALSTALKTDSKLRNKVWISHDEDKNNQSSQSSSTSTTSETGGITSDSKLNMEILKTLRQLNATLMDMNQVNGRSNVYATNF